MKYEEGIRGCSEGKQIGKGVVLKYKKCKSARRKKESGPGQEKGPVSCSERPKAGRKRSSGEGEPSVVDRIRPHCWRFGGWEAKPQEKEDASLGGAYDPTGAKCREEGDRVSHRGLVARVGIFPRKISNGQVNE